MQLISTLINGETWKRNRYRFDEIPEGSAASYDLAEYETSAANIRASAHTYAKRNGLRAHTRKVGVALLVRFERVSRRRRAPRPEK